MGCKVKQLLLFLFYNITAAFYNTVYYNNKPRFYHLSLFTSKYKQASLYNFCTICIRIRKRQWYFIQIELIIQVYIKPGKTQFKYLSLAVLIHIESSIQNYCMIGHKLIFQYFVLIMNRLMVFLTTLFTGIAIFSLNNKLFMGNNKQN